LEPVYSVARTALLPPLRYGMRWTIEGAHLIPPRGPVILASNHTSYLDPLALAYLADRRHRRVRFLTKAELFDKKPLGLLLHQVHQIPVVRNSPTAAGSLELAVEALKRGECVAIFPEGTISLDLEPMAGKSGTARLAAQSGVPVTPVGLWGAQVRVHADEDVLDATDRIMGAIARCVARAREIYPQRPGPGDDGWWQRRPETAQVRPANRIEDNTEDVETGP
jgi:1-acyl-sn-glycerol-3-phosphate acyltransferase